MNVTDMFRNNTMLRQVTESVMIDKVEDHQHEKWTELILIEYYHTSLASAYRLSVETNLDIKLLIL